MSAKPEKTVCCVPLGNGAKDLPQHFFTVSTSSETTRWPSASVPQKRGTLPSASYSARIIIIITSALQYEVTSVQNGKEAKFQTHCSKEDIFCGAVIEHKSEFAMKISNNLVIRIRTTISECSIGFNHNGDFCSCFG